MISLVIPTYNEAAVISETLRRAGAALRSCGQNFEIIVVDDSSGDGTAECVEALKGEMPVRLFKREGRRGLATAIVEGWSMARGDLLGVMDADLQHPPEVLPSLARALEMPNVDLAIASRYISGGGTSRWPWRRRLISWTATHLAASVLPWTLAAVTDPMSGLFFVRASALEGVRLDPIGYKILLEVLAKAHYRELVEVPYVFDQRGRGTSKAGARQGLEYLQHLLRLARSTGQLAAWIRYGLIGASGAAVNLGALGWLAVREEASLSWALPLSIQLALLSNGVLNHTFTFRGDGGGRKRGTGFLGRLLRYERVCLPGAVLNALVTLALFGQGFALLSAAAAGIGVGGVWNFLLNVPAIWRIWGSRSAPEQRCEA